MLELYARWIQEVLDPKDSFRDLPTVLDLEPDDVSLPARRLTADRTVGRERTRALPLRP